MEGVKNAWRNAACLLFVTGPFRYSRQSALAMRPLMEAHSKEKPLPTSNFLELNSQAMAEEDMEMIFVQRHSKSGFMPNMQVFPGGVLDKADYSPKWMNMFSPIPFSTLTSKNNLPVYSQVPSDNTTITGEVALRICAIREMFEEAGVLLVREKSDLPPLLDVLPGTFSPAVRILPDSTREHWRERVHNNAEEFLTLCNEMNCVPDIWSLIEWSNWLTPRNHKRRYDTVFYMVFSETKPSLCPDGIEVTKSSWMSPSVAARKHQTGEVMFAPPQFAEIKKLQAFPGSPCLHSFAIHNCLTEGNICRKLSVRILTKNGILVSVTDQDDLYPDEGSEDWKTKIQHPQSPHLRGEVELVLTQQPGYEYECPKHTEKDLFELSETLSRMEMHGMHDIRSFDNSINVRPVIEHIRKYTSLYNSKL